MQARDDQMIGRFAAAVRLAESMRTDDACYSAFQNRLAPQRCLSVNLLAGKGPKSGQAISEGEALFGQGGIALHPDVMSDIVGCLANHGIAIGVNQWTPRADGSRVDVEHHLWPLEFVWYNPAARCLMTRIDPYPSTNSPAFGTVGLPQDHYGNPQPLNSNLVPIVHGDGRWTIYQKHEFMPWRADAAILPASLVWASHAYAMRDWIKGSSAHGTSKIVGELPQGFDIGALGTPTPESNAFVQLLEAIASDETPFGIKPFGSNIEILSNPSRMWEVFAQLVENREKAAHRIYTGTDAALGSQSGAPGIDIASLFGVSQTIVQGDIEAIQRGIQTGIIQPWAAMNFGDSLCAPFRKYNLPDADADAERKSFGDRMTAFCKAVSELKNAGFEICPDVVSELSDKFGVFEPKIADAPVVLPQLSIVKR